MKERRTCFGALVALLLAFQALPGRLQADDPALEAWMPENVIGCVRITGLRGRLDEFLASSARKELESMDLVRHALSQGGGLKLREALDEFRSATGKDPIQVAGDLFGKEVLAGVRFQLSGPEVLIVSRGSGEKEVEAALDALRISAEKHLGRPLAREEASHGDGKIELYEGGKLCIARRGAFLAASSTRAGLENILDLGSRKATGSVESASFFQKGRAAGKDALVFTVLRPKFIPNFQGKDRYDEAGESLLFGGIGPALSSSDLITGALRVSGGKLEVTTAIHPADKAAGEKVQAAYFPPTSEAYEFQARLRDRGAVAFLHLRRDLHRWWEAREEIMSPKAAGDLLQFANTMNQVFGRNFQDEILPEIGPDITFLARTQEYPGLSEKPKPAIPGFALVFELKSTKTLGNRMVAAFQTIVAFINADQAQKKKDEGMSMLVRTEKIGKYDLHTVALVDDEGPPGMMHNFTPSLAVAGSKVIVSSSAELAKVFLEEAEGKTARSPPAGSAEPTGARPTGAEPTGARPTGAEPPGDTLSIDGVAVRKILGENHEFLIADNMVKKGHSKEQAETEIGILYAILDRLRDLKVRTWKDDGALRIRLDLGTKWASGAASAEPEAKRTADKGVRL